MIEHAGPIPSVATADLRAVAHSRWTAAGRSLAVVSAMASVYFLVLLLPSLSPHYGFYSDELYYLACAKRLAFGYVDHPPLFLFVLRLQQELLGDSLVALRALPAMLGALTAFLAGWMARRMGGGLFAQVLATLAVTVSPQFLAWFSFFSVNCLEVPLWATASWIVLERCRTQERRLWVVLGVVLGLSFLTKHTTVLLIVGLAVGAILTPLRGDWRGKWPWIGALVALGIASPNLYWQVIHDWPSLEFYQRVAESNLPTSPLGVVFYQVLFQNPAALPIWLAGIPFFLTTTRGRSFRPLGWAFLVLFVLAIAGGQRRADRIAGIYPVVFAGGAVLLETIRGASRRRRAWITWAMPSLMILFALTATTLALPILPPDVLAKHPLWDGTDDWREEVAPQKIPYHLGNRTHWKELVADVARVYARLDPAQRDGAIILADYFGHAGALEWYGGNALPPVYSPHTGYFLWGPPAGSPDPLISIGIDEVFLRANFEHVREAAVFRCDYCPRWQDELPIHVASSPKRTAAEYWPELGRIGGMDSYRRRLRAKRAAAVQGEAK